MTTSQREKERHWAVRSLVKHLWTVLDAASLFWSNPSSNPRSGGRDRPAARERPGYRLWHGKSQDYEYDIFISYRHKGPAYSWVTEYFHPMLEQWLPEHVPDAYYLTIGW